MLRKIALLLIAALAGLALRAADSTGRKLLYTFPIRENIMPSVERLTAKCFAQAAEMGADVVLIQMNTYGGMVDVADSVRTAVLNSPVPVWVLIDNQAASAGALIALAADSIYIRPGGSIGAASVVDASGKPMPDKFQSFMRATMRATAEAHGRVVERIDGTDTVWRWHRDPLVAEAMVGATSGDSTTINVLTLTADEALAKHYSEGSASSVREVMSQAGIADYDVYEYKPDTLDKVLGWLMNPVAQGLFIMLIIGGIYFELQTPGVGLPLLAAVLGAVLYFAPLYLEGFLQYWELILFVAGLILILVEIFVLPGFGVAGGTGIALALWLGRRFLSGHSPLRERIVLTTSMKPSEGYVGNDVPQKELVGKTGTATSVMRPSGRVQIDGSYYEAVAEDGFFIERGSRIVVVRIEGGQLYCRKAGKE